MLGIDMAFWVGMGVTAGLVVAGCLAAWLVPAKKNESE